MDKRRQDRYYKMISKKDYEDKKEYWDFQRKVEYNKEKVYEMAERFEGRVHSEMGPVSLAQLKETLWTKVRTEDYEEPHKGWIPQNENYKFEWEQYKTSSPKPKGKWQDLADEMSMYIGKENE